MSKSNNIVKVEWTLEIIWYICNKRVYDIILQLKIFFKKKNVYLLIRRIKNNVNIPDDLKCI